MTIFQKRLQQLEAYQKEIGSKKTYLYEVYRTESDNGSCTIILADTDDEARVAALIMVPDATWLRMDHWGKGPRINLTR